MKKIPNIYKALPLCLLVMASIGSCTKLQETLTNSKSSGATETGVGVPGPIAGVYSGLDQLLGQGNAYAMQEHTTDEILGPTRGTDWDDFGTWRKLHLHTWDGSHNQVNDTWNGLNGALYQATLVAETASGQTKAEAQFIRAYLMYQICDLYGQVPYVPATATATDIGSVLSRSAAVDFMIKDLDAAIAGLPSYTHAGRTLASKESAQFLEAKIYLNKTVYKHDPATPAGPFTFDAADMSKVIALVDAISVNSSLSVSTFYWDNFKWDNGTKSTENIFVRQNKDMRWATYMGAHYNMAPSGWNGFTTLSDFYNSFDTADTRRSAFIPGYSDSLGRNAGFLVGQLRGPAGGKIGNPIVDLKDRSGNPLIFTPDVSLFFSTESQGIRTTKYPLDPSTINAGGSASQNEFVFFRFSDARLMKAEAILRGGAATNGETSLSIVNAIRANRNVLPLTALTLPNLLAERGRELYLEAWRRNDMIRYGVFNAPVGQRPNASPGSKCVFPIPNIALSSNPNLKQNFGY